MLDLIPDIAVPLALKSLWHFITSSASLGVLIGSAALFVAIALPKPLDWITDLRKWALVVAFNAFAFTAIAGKFFHDGLKVKQDQWDASIAAEAIAGDTIRDEAERSIRVEPPDSRVLRDDPWNRDNWNKPGGG